MRFATTLTLLGVAATAQAAVAPRAKTNCPAVWTTVATQLTTFFYDATTGTCTDLARAAIRFAFHDAATWNTSVPAFGGVGGASGAADASLLLVPSEIDRPENNGLQDYKTFLQSFYANFTGQLGAADLVYFAGNAAVSLCPGGPQVKTVTGRRDSDGTPSVEGLMPPGFGPGSDADSLVALFEAKGFSAADLAALVGAHSTSKAVGQAPNVPVGGAQDDTPGLWDVDFYSNTYTPPANVYRFDSDIALSNTSTAVGAVFKSFVNNQSRWNTAFADAMYRLSILGVPANFVALFTDCTTSLPKAERV